MVMVILHYRTLKPTLEELRAHKEPDVPFFENDIPGLIDKTWGMDEETGRGASVYHFEDRATADAWFNSERQRTFRKTNGASLEFLDVGAVAVRRHLKELA
jgi:hypothetical protein